ncbi:hypothetical protein FRB97_007195 [Tulasnella sp. 331]|nr:hypothetical protein FRB97_007195 [Tulasnella sp. 331]KAG8890441.1 hypothetical protein FRB98_008476 [Tulasnella sp. 332]
MNPFLRSSWCQSSNASCPTRSAMSSIQSTTTASHNSGSATPNIDNDLARSKNAPLDIILRRLPEGSDPKNWEKILGVVSRWRTAGIWFAGRGLESRGEWGSILETSLQNATAPMLTSLRLHQISSPRDNFTANLFRVGTTPRLRELELETFCLRNWDSPFLSNLTTLSLSKIFIDGPSLSQLLTILEACPDIEVLRLADCNFALDAHLRTPPTRRVHLLHISTFHVHRLGTDASDHLLREIDAPSCRDFDIHWGTLAVEPAEACSEFITPLFRSYIHSAENVRIIVTSKFVEVEGNTRGRDDGFRVKIHKLASRNLWPILILPLFTPPQPTLQLSLRFNLDRDHEIPLDDVRGLPGVTKVTVDGPYSGAILVEALGSVFGDDEVTRWLWPKLRGLEIDGVLGPRILAMAEARALAHTEQGGQQQRPVVFEGLVLGRQCHISSRTLEKLKNIVGEGLEWKSLE